MKGCAGGPGNPAAHRAARLRALVAECVTDDDLRAVIGKLLEMAKAGDGMAIRELLDRLLGKSIAAMAVDVTTTSPDGSGVLVEAMKARPDVAIALNNVMRQLAKPASD